MLPTIPKMDHGVTATTPAQHIFYYLVFGPDPLRTPGLVGLAKCQGRITGRIAQVLSWNLLPQGIPPSLPPTTSFLSQGSLSQNVRNNLDHGHRSLTIHSHGRAHMARG